MPSLPKENQTGCEKFLLAQVFSTLSSGIFRSSEGSAKAAGSPVKMSWELAILSPSAYFTMDFTGSPLAGTGSWHLLPSTPAMLPTAAKHFDRAGCMYVSSHSNGI